MSTFLPAEKGMTIRQPSTANLMLDSADRPNPTTTRANDFQISRPQSILNGFFTRLGTTEVVMEYNTPNISQTLGNNTLTIDLSGTVSGTLTTTITAQGMFTVANLIDLVVSSLNDLSGSWTAAAIGTPSGPGASIAPAAPVYAQFTGPIANLLDIDTGALDLYGPDPITEQQVGVFPILVDLRPFRYLDFVSPQLTYNQDLKDSTTALVVRDVLCRWYMAWDNPPQLDAYGFPILMGYTPFTLRRTFSPPKQIRWDNIQPIGNLAFQVYTDQNVLAPFNFNTNWLMTLQASEV